MKWPPVVEAWMYRDPAEHADALIARSARHERRAEATAGRNEKDRYYTAARRIEIKQAMRGRK